MKNFRCLVLIAGLILCTLQSEAQEKSFLDTSATFEHFIGLQANALIQQVFNFGESDELLNPYVVKYTLKHRPTGLSFNIGGGLDRSSSKEEGGLLTEDESYDVRLGPGWQKSLSDRIEFGVGVDFVFGRSFRETSSVSTVVFNGGTDSTITVVRNKSDYFGAGVQLSLSYKLTPSILIGTEASCYAFSGETIDNSIVDNYLIQSNSNQDVPIRSILKENTTTEVEEIALNLPIVLFLQLRF